METKGSRKGIASLFIGWNELCGPNTDAGDLLSKERTDSEGWLWTMGNSGGCALHAEVCVWLGHWTPREMNSIAVQCLLNIIQLIKSSLYRTGPGMSYISRLWLVNDYLWNLFIFEWIVYICFFQIFVESFFFLHKRVIECWADDFTSSQSKIQDYQIFYYYLWFWIQKSGSMKKEI